MKKFLLSSIIMLGVCGAVNAQNATGSKFKKNDVSPAATSTSAAVPTPQKAAVMPPSDDLAPAPATKTAADKEAAAAAPATPQTKAQIKAAQAASATSVNAAGVVVTSDEAKEKAEKAAAIKAANESEKKNKQ